MAYLHSYSDRQAFGFLGCGPACPCGGLCPRRNLGETYVRDEDEEPAASGWFGAYMPGFVGLAEPAQRTALDPRIAAALRQSEAAGLQAAIAAGIRDEIRLTNLVFHRRHPELQGRRILPGETALANDWREIRDRLVRPVLGRGATRPGPAPRPSPVPVPGVQPGAPCPKEDPHPESRHRPGVRCAPDGRKCWPRQASLDIIDPDLPCNGENQRSPAAYSAVLDYFNVAHPRNERYQTWETPRGRATYCNIYVHDVTRALRASIPHWVRDPSQTRDTPRGWNELSANRTFDWMLQHGPSIGWMRIDPALIDWVNQQFNRRQSLPFPGSPLPAGVLSAGSRVAASSHPHPPLLRQDSYVAQQFANLGLPTVIIWKNLQGRSGHVAMVRPETQSRQGQVHQSGMFLPRSAQAGRHNFENELATWIVRASGRLLFVHA